jgi:hypothetical protein
MRTRAVLLVVGALLGLTGSAGAATYNCLPVELLEETNRFHVLCAEPRGEGEYPRDGSDQVRFFAVPKSDADFAHRFEHITQTALVSGLVVQFQYKSGDTSGTAFGCAAADCRQPFAVGLLAPSASVRIPYAVWPDGSTVPIAKGTWAH